jgi:hypothetical protein
MRGKNKSKITLLKLGRAKYAGAEITRANTVNIFEHSDTQFVPPLKH